jgi:uncharacterized protein YukE
MPQVIVNPDEMRRFANALDEWRESLQQKKFNAARAFDDLRNFWKDEKYFEFDKSFTKTVEDLDYALKMAKVYADFLRKKAAKADRYLGRS